MSEKSKRLGDLAQLIVEENFVGAVIQQDYEQMLIATNDYLRINSGGVPQNCFLTVAAAPEEGEDEVSEVVLVSVRGPMPMQTQRELLAVREEIANSLAQGIEAKRNDMLDVKLSSQALTCKILGSFYKDEEGNIQFGADVDNIRSSASLRVYRPTGEALSFIASFSTRSRNSEAMLEVGKVRYTETRKKIDEDAAVYVNVEDLLATKTALFGMTRSGKSNTTKVILQKIHQFTHERGKPVAQLIMDPQGEYANSNSQDGSALANIGDENHVSIYKMMEKRSNPKEKFLQFNIFAEENLALTYDLILAELRNGISAEANYIAPLFSQEFELLGENATTQQKIHHARKKLGLFALMYEGVKNYPVKPFSLSLPEAVLEAIRENKVNVEFSSYKSNEVLIRSTGDAWRVANVLLEKKETNDLNESWNNEFNEGDAGVFLEQLIQIKEKGRNGVKGAIARIEALHSLDAEGDVRDNVWQDIQAGKLIVVDLSRGSMETSRALSELIVNYLLAQASERFINGLDPVPFQIVVEEAHNLFERDSRKGESDPWVRISKEAAKYHIGLVYATQEISSVDKRILSNTSNFVISALSSSKEIIELANYYAFGDWADHIKRVETKGFVRLKTQSSPFIIPVQMEKFEVSSMSEVSARAARKAPELSTAVEDSRKGKARAKESFVPSETLDDFAVPDAGEFDELEF